MGAQPESHASRGPGEWYYTLPDKSLNSVQCALTDRELRSIDTNLRPAIIPRPEHSISRAEISNNALKVLYRLKSAGFQSYLVGGGVRDLLLGHEPKDFDVVTDARPDEVRALFRNCRLIGRRFRLAHVHFGREIVEVATFRAHHDSAAGGEAETVGGRILRDNVYGSFEEDAARRDFTINALYYDIRDFSLVDTAGGLDDLKAGVIRLIGDPEVRFREDPVRMLRAVRFAAKLGFRLHADTERVIPGLGELLLEVPPARLFDEVLKLFHGGTALQAFELLRHYGLFAPMFPATEQCLEEQTEGFPRLLIARALANTDARIAEGKPVTPAFLFAALLWEPMCRRMDAYREEGHSVAVAMQRAGEDVMVEQVHRVSIPRRFSTVSREIWGLQPRLAVTTGKRPARVLEHSRFRAAYDFLLLRAEAGEELQDLCEWWTRFQELDESERAVMLKPAKAKRRRSRSRRRSG